jgi:hypothetical protein
MPVPQPDNPAFSDRPLSLISGRTVFLTDLAHFGIAVCMQVSAARFQSAVTCAMSALLHSPGCLPQALVTTS